MRPSPRARLPSACRSSTPGKRFPRGGQYASDPIHLNDAGHSALARYVANRIAEIEGWTMPACPF
jgi:lysophospholipase L1-like esterase